VVVLSGGVFQNRRLLERTAARLVRGDLRVLVPERVPPNDGGIAFGQAAVAAARGAR
jgi:hydrogenase maturation protein HypF